MKKTVLILLAFIMLLPVIASAERSLQCNFIWSTAVTSTTDDPPDYVYCRDTQRSTEEYTSMGATYAMDVSKAYSIDFQIDTTSTGALSQNGVTVCSNTATVTIGVHGSIDNSSFDTGGVYYHSFSFSDADRQTKGLTPSLPYVRFSITEASAANGCVVIRALATWR